VLRAGQRVASIPGFTQQDEGGRLLSRVAWLAGWLAASRGRAAIVDVSYHHEASDDNREGFQGPV
jgi:hypothetical protein